MGMKNLGSYLKGSSSNTPRKRTSKFKSKGMTYETHGAKSSGFSGYGANKSDYVSKGAEKMGGTSRKLINRHPSKMINTYRSQSY